MSPLRWTSKSVRHLATALQRMGHQVSHQLVAELLAEAGYSLQANRKAREGTSIPIATRNFGTSTTRFNAFQAATQPVISVDTKKKELVGDFKNLGREWHPRDQPTRVRVHDFIIPERGKAIPYGVYDLTRNAGWVSVGIDHDTATFAARGCACGSGSCSAWRTAPAWRVTVCHFPPGTSKWNKIEHRLFSYISSNWRGQPLVSLAVIVNLIGATRTADGLRVRCELDTGRYPKGQDVSDAAFAAVRFEPHRFHGDWNYTIQPRRGRP